MIKVQRLTLGWVAKQLDMPLGKFTIDVRNGIYPFVKATKKDEKSTKYIYSFNSVETFEYIEKYKKYQKYGIQDYNE